MLLICGARKLYGCVLLYLPFGDAVMMAFASWGVVMAKPPYRALKILLRVLSVLLVVGSVFMIFSSKPMVVRAFMRPPEAEVSTLLLFMVKEMGGMILMLAALLWFASRDPVRNVAIIDALIIGFCVLAVTPLISFWTLPVRAIYPGYLIWGRSVIRLVIAGVFYWLRPRSADAAAWRA